MDTLEGNLRNHFDTLPMEGVQGVHLRLMSPADALEIQQLAQDDPELGTWQYWAREPENIPQYLDEAAQNVANGQWIQYRIVKNEENEPIIGTVTLYARDDGGGYNMGYWLITPEQGKGYATSAVKSLLQYTKQHIGLETVSLWIAEENYSSQKLAVNLGAQPGELTRPGDDGEGTMRVWELYF